MLFDAHLHYKNHENGGFLIGLEGNPKFEGTLDNKEVLKLHCPKDKYFAFYYVCNNAISNKIEHPLLKYHPRREGYSKELVSASIKLNTPKVVIVDTLNEPYWNAYDYWYLAKENPTVTFIMAHSGGYLINEFIKMCHFQKNIWIDFALTHTVLGKLGDITKGLNYINDAIKYALNSSFNDRILLASDFPFYDQDEVFKYYSEYEEMLNKNFLRLVAEKIIK